MRLSLLIAAALPAALAADCSSNGQYNVIPGFAGSKYCVPGGYLSAQDLGNTSPTDLVSRCEAQCTSQSNCQAYVGSLWKAADSDLYTGTCFYYSTPPTGPQECVDHPYDLIAEKKDHSLECLATATSASEFCTSFLSVSTVTVYTSTSTPVTSLTTTSYTTRTTTRTSVVDTTISTSTRVITKPTKVYSSTTTTTRVVRATSTTVVTVGGASISVVKRESGAESVPTPTCLSDTPETRISSACSCIVTTSTISTVSEAPTSTVTVFKTTKTSASTTIVPSTKVVLTRETTTTFSTSFYPTPLREIDSSTTTVKTVTSTVTSAQVQTS